MPNLPSSVSVFSELTGSSSEVNYWNFNEMKAIHSFYILGCTSPPPLLRSSGFLHDCGTCHNPVLLLTSSPSSNTRPRWLFSFWILVDVVRLDPRTGPRAAIPAEELWTIFVLLSNSLHIAGGSGRGKRWVSPFLKFTWTCVQKAWRRRATLKHRSLPPRHKWLLDTVDLRADGK